MTKHTFNPGRLTVTTLALAALLITLNPVPADAGDFPEGLFIGLDAGFGGSMVDYEDGKKSISEDAVAGGMGGLRIGYGVSSKLALSFEGHGFGRDTDGENEWGVGAGVLAVTWRPRGGGFFVRSGAGLGGGEYKSLDNNESVELQQRFAWTFAVGYDWRMGEHTSLGLAFESIGLDAGGTTGFEEDGVGAAGMTAQFTWHP